jgi:hypothetical protein
MMTRPPASSQNQFQTGKEKTYLALLFPGSKFLYLTSSILFCTIYTIARRPLEERSGYGR